MLETVCVARSVLGTVCGARGWRCCVRSVLGTVCYQHDVPRAAPQPVVEYVMSHLNIVSMWPSVFYPLELKVRRWQGLSDGDDDGDDEGESDIEG